MTYDYDGELVVFDIGMQIKMVASGPVNARLRRDAADAVGNYMD